MTLMNDDVDVETLSEFRMIQNDGDHDDKDIWWQGCMMSDDVDAETHPLCQSAHIKALTAHLSFPFGYNMDHDDDDEDDDCTNYVMTRL